MVTFTCLDVVKETITKGYAVCGRGLPQEAFIDKLFAPSATATERYPRG